MRLDKETIEGLEDIQFKALGEIKYKQFANMAFYYPYLEEVLEFLDNHCAKRNPDKRMSMYSNAALIDFTPIFALEHFDSHYYQDIEYSNEQALELIEKGLIYLEERGIIKDLEGHTNLVGHGFFYDRFKFSIDDNKKELYLYKKNTNEEQMPVIFENKEQLPLANSVDLIYASGSFIPKNMLYEARTGAVIFNRSGGSFENEVIDPEEYNLDSLNHLYPKEMPEMVNIYVKKPKVQVIRFRRL